MNTKIATLLAEGRYAAVCDAAADGDADAIAECRRVMADPAAHRPGTVAYVAATLAEIDEARAARTRTRTQISTDPIIDSLRLPEGTHACVLTGTTAAMSNEESVTVVWADRPFGRCPTCDQPVERVVGCPVMLDLGVGAWAETMELGQQHGCGEHLWVEWVEVEDASPEAVLAAAQELADALRKTRRRG